MPYTATHAGVRPPCTRAQSGFFTTPADCPDSPASMIRSTEEYDTEGSQAPSLAYGRVRSDPEPHVVGAFVALVAVLYFFGGMQLQVLFGEAGLLAAEWLLLLVPVAILVAYSGFDPGRTLSLRMPTLVGVVGGVVLIAGAAPLVWLVGWLQAFVLPVPRELLEGLEELITADTPSRMLWLLLLLAFTPAVCEEIVFRGVLLGGTRRLAPWRMVLLNGVVFGAFHLSFETVIRFLPTATLGVVIAWAVWRTGSIWVGMLMHFLNNATIIFLASAPSLREAFLDPRAPPPLWLVPLGAILLAVGARLLLRNPPPIGGRTNPTEGS